MKIYFRFLLVTAFAIAVDADTAVQVSNDARIVGGKPSAQGAYPFYAVPDGNYLCGASLIHPDILISAAHCKGSFINNNIYIGGNTLDGSDAAETLVVTAERIHPSFNNTIEYSNDFMLIKLNKASKAPLVSLNTNSAKPVDNESVKVIGFGDTQYGGYVSASLLEVYVNVVGFSTCQSDYPGEIDKNSMICAAANGKDSCNGDSGGPLLDQQGTMDGIVSWGDRCAVNGKPGVYARVSSAIDFITKGICDLSSYPPASCNLSPPTPTSPVAPAPKPSPVASPTKPSSTANGPVARAPTPVPPASRPVASPIKPSAPISSPVAPVPKPIAPAPRPVASPTKKVMSSHN
jgi:secreted trypsin-like serine protease